MAPPLYFFARQQLSDVVDAQADRFRPSLLREAALDDTFSDVLSVANQTATNELVKAGPGGASGVLTTVLPASGECPKRTGFHPDFQDWRRTGPDLWIGTDREHPPAPEDLLRSNATRLAGGEMRAAHAGYQYRLADGRYWEVPVIRRPAVVARHGRSITGLPMDIDWDAEGRFVETIKPEYQALWDDTESICDLFFEPDGTHRQGRFEISIETGLKWCLRILSLNYRYGRHEQRLLHAIDKTNVFTVLGLAVDAPLVNHLLAARQKKTDPSAPEAANTPPGSTADSETTGLAAASSS
jgi:hypothetical protein